MSVFVLFNKVYDDVTGEMLACLTGEHEFHTVVSDSHQIRVHFYSDGSVTESGFDASYTTHSPGVTIFVCILTVNLYKKVKLYKKTYIFLLNSLKRQGHHIPQ